MFVNLIYDQYILMIFIDFNFLIIFVMIMMVMLLHVYMLIITVIFIMIIFFIVIVLVIIEVVLFLFLFYFLIVNSIVFCNLSSLDSLCHIEIFAEHLIFEPNRFDCLNLLYDHQLFLFYSFYQATFILKCIKLRLALHILNEFKWIIFINLNMKKD